MGLLVMILGFALFFAAHVFTTKREARAQAIARLGEGTYKILYSLVSLAGLALITWGFGHYRATGWIDVWYPPKAMKHITIALMLPAVILVVASYLRGRIYATLLFGSFLGWAVYDRISLKHRTDSGAPPIPVGGVSNDLIAVAVGVVAYLALAFAFHPVVIGVPVMGG